LTVAGALQTLLLLLAVWWAWMDTAWVTNWLDPDRRATRAMLLGAMLASLFMAAAIPDAFVDRGLAFALAFAALQVGRTVFVIWATRSDVALRTNFERFLIWRCAAATFWIAGGIGHGSVRTVLWIVAVTIDFLGPLMYFVVPVLGRSQIEDWSIAGDHLAERCHLFLIVTFGESVLVTGATLSDLAWTASSVAAVAVCFAGAAALWWIYFDASAERGTEVISASPTPGRLGRSAYTYWHLPMVAGIIVTAVGDELVIRHPGGEPTTATALTVLGGPALFLGGHAFFKQTLFGRFSTQRVVAVLLLVAVIPVGLVAAPIVSATLVMIIVGGVAVTDGVLHRADSTP
jgi:low temperature requirement protein LtrA